MVEKFAPVHLFLKCTKSLVYLQLFILQSNRSMRFLQTQGDKDISIVPHVPRQACEFGKSFYRFAHGYKQPTDIWPKDVYLCYANAYKTTYVYQCYQANAKVNARLTVGQEHTYKLGSFDSQLVAPFHSLRRLKQKTKKKRLPSAYVTFDCVDTSDMSLTGTIAGQSSKSNELYQNMSKVPPLLKGVTFGVHTQKRTRCNKFAAGM